MLLTSPIGRTAVLLVLTAIAAALMVMRVNASQERGDAAPSAPTVFLARHTPGSAAHERHEYRLQVARATAASGG